MDKLKGPPLLEAFLYGTPGAIRTHGTRIRNPLLYPAELRGLICLKAEFLTLFMERVNYITRIFKRAGHASKVTFYDPFFRKVD